MPQTNHGSIEFLKFPNPQYPGDRTKLIKKWLRDSWARRKIAALQQAVAAIVVPTKTSDLTNDSGFITAASVPSASAVNPAMDGTAAPGTSGAWARGDHVHPHDTSKADAATTYTKTEVDGMIPTVPDASNATPIMDGTGAAGTSGDYARADHVHPHDTAKQDALTSAQLAAVNSGITADDLAVNDASVLCTVTPIIPTLDAGSHYSAYDGCWYYKVGHRVTVHIGVTDITANANVVLFTLPTGYRPRSLVAFIGNANSISTYSRLRVQPDGTVRVYSASTYALGEISFDAFS